MGKLNKRDILQCLKEGKYILLLAAFLLFIGWYYVFGIVTARAPEEVINISLGVYAWRADDTEARLLDAVKDDGIAEVNVSHFDISNFDNYVTYLSTYGAVDTDILLLDGNVTEALMADKLEVLSEEQRILFQEILPQVRFTPDGKGILVHIKGDEAYNGLFPALHEKLLFASQGDEFDFALYLATDRPHKDITIKAMAALIELWKEN